MIQINELRVGNLIQEGKIEQIDKSIDEVYYSGNGYYQSNYCCNLKPIPLTEDWLLRFKEIQRIDEGLFSIDGERYIELTFKGDGYNVDVGGIVICFVDTVHALQNLFFALTNKELCVK